LIVTNWLRSASVTVWPDEVSNLMGWGFAILFVMVFGAPAPDYLGAVGVAALAALLFACTLIIPRYY
jgi:hypothetical protein